MRFFRSIGAALALLAATNLALAQGAVPQPKAPNRPAGDNSAYVANTAYTDAAVAALLASVTGSLAQKAPLASPTFTGLVKVPTAAAGSSDTTAASTAFVQSTAQTIANSIAAAGYAPLASPTFTGSPKVPTLATADTSTGIANAAFVQAAITSAVGTLGSSAVRADGAQTFTDAQKAQARQNIFVPGVQDFRTLAIQMSKIGGVPVPMFGGLAEGFKSPGSVDLTTISGGFVDTNAGQLVGGVGGPVSVVENSPTLPKMISATATATGATGYAVSASSFQTNNDPWYGFDGAGGNGWVSSAATFPQWLQLKTNAPIRVAGYAITGWYGGGGNSAAAWQLQASNDATFATYSVLDAQTGQALAAATRYTYTVPSANQGNYQYHRLFVTATQNANVQVGVTELELLQYTPAFETDTSLPAMISETAVASGANGYSVFYNSQRDTAGNASWNVFSGARKDANSVSRWSPNGNGVGSYIGRTTPSAITLGGYAITKYNDSSTDSYPTAWRVQGTNDATAATNPGGASWTTLDTRTGATFGSIAAYGRIMYSIPAANQGAYKYHRLLIDAVGGGYVPALYLASLEFLQVINGVEAQTSIPYMTGANAVTTNATGYSVFSSSAARGAGYEPYRAADGIRPTLGADNVSPPQNWSGSGATPYSWGRGFPAPVKVLAYRIASQGAYSPIAWQLRGSNTNNGTDWATLDTRSTAGTNWWSTTIGDWTYFTVPAPAAYTYYQINITNGGTDGYSRLAEVEFLQGTTGVMDVKSTPFAAVSVPTKGSIFLLTKTAAGTLTPNVNFTAWISRDNGVNWGAFTLASVGTWNGFNVLEANGKDLTTIGSGSTIRYRLQSNDATLGLTFGGMFVHWN